MVKVILFDLWGTIIENGVFPSPVRQIKRILRINLDFSDYIVKFEEVFMLREFDNLTEAFKEICNEFELTPPDFVVDKCVGLWNKNAILAKPFEESLEVLSTLKEKYKLVLLSNTDQFSADQVIKKFDLEKYFDKIVLSYKHGKLKTNPETFKDIANDMGVDVTDMVMIGDSLESDMKPAEEAGAKAVLVDRRDRREHDPKVLTLSGIEEVI